MKSLTKVALILTTLALSVGAYAHWGNSSGNGMINDNTQYQAMSNSGQNPQEMQNWREHMGNTPEEHYQWMEKMHKQFFGNESVSMREYCSGFSGHMGKGMGMGWFNQPDNSLKESK